MDKKGLLYYFNVVYFIAGELFLLIFGIPTVMTPRVDQWFRITILAVGLAILAVTLARFAHRYHQKPSHPRMTILLGLAFFVVAFGAKLLTTSIDMHDTLRYDRYYYDMALYAVVTSMYCFLLFGISMLITPFSKKPRSGLKIVTDVIFAAAFTVFFAGQLFTLFTATEPAEETTKSPAYVTIIMLVVALYVMTILVVMAIKALRLAKKADKEAHRKGMNALGTSFLLLVATVVLLIANTAMLSEYNRYLEIVTISLAVVMFYFLYLGFVRPSDAEKQAT